MNHENTLKAIRTCQARRGDLVLVLIDSRKPTQECIEKENAAAELEAERGARVIPILNDMPVIVMHPNILESLGLRIANRGTVPDRERR